MVCSAGDVITLWTTSNWSKVKQFKGHEDRVESVQLRLRGGYDPLMGVVISASRDTSVKYWDVYRYTGTTSVLHAEEPFCFALFPGPLAASLSNLQAIFQGPLSASNFKAHS